MTRAGSDSLVGPLAAIAVATLTLAACAGSAGGNSPGQLDRIDGPAQVDDDVQVGDSPANSDG